MTRIILTLLLFNLSLAQEYGFISFEAEDTWIIEINDTLITSNDILKIEGGTYKLHARPQISYSWPAIRIESEVIIMAGDTIYFQLSAENSVASPIDMHSDLPKTTSYNNTDYNPNTARFSKLKTGLLITTIAANWLSFYLKREADRNYSKYRRASSSSDIDKYYNLAGNLDIASSAALSISAAALTAYIYVALTE